MTESTVRKTAKDFSRSHEPIVWGLFSGGGVIVAFITPVLVLITALLVPLGIADESMLAYDRVIAFAQAWWGKLFILGVIALQLFHTAHRIYHGLHDLHIEGNPTFMHLLFYGGSTILSCVVIAWLLAVGW